jgi:3D (Asp-Asp-Asp) domain-containing protein
MMIMIVLHLFKLLFYLASLTKSYLANLSNSQKYDQYVHDSKNMINVIPMFSKMRIKLWDGTVVNAQALDVGGAFRGNLIDIYLDTVNEAINLGRKRVLVEVY